MNNIFNTIQAAEYLGISFPTIKHHIYHTKKLKADQKIGGRLFFQKETLDAFNENRRKPGRPRADEE